MASITNRAAVLMAVVLAGCAGAPVSTSGPSLPLRTPSPTQGLTTGPTPLVTSARIEPTATPGVTCAGRDPATTFEPDSIVCVVGGQMRARSRPSTADDSVIFEPIFETGQLFFIIDGPAEGSGYTWYLVEGTPGYAAVADGWVVAAEDGNPWLAAASVPCPADPSLHDLGSMDALQRLHCYHDREFTFTDTVIAGPNCGDGNVLESPSWMAGCASTFWWGERPSGAIVAIPPDLADSIGEVELPDGSFEATITAHMDDPAALTCQPYEGVEADYTLLVPGTVLTCRTMFVATSIERMSP